MCGGGVKYDYLIIASSRFYSEIRQEAISLSVSEDRIIDGSIFNRPLFDFKRYVSLLSNPVTILSDDCWGGYVYHALKLPFSSPCINIWWPKDSYSKFIQNPIYYLQQPLELVCDGDIRKNITPIGKLGSEKNEIQMLFLHQPSFRKAKEYWEKRVKRINPNRIFVKMALSAYDKHCSEYLEIFNNLSFPKICFYSGETNIRDVVYFKRFEWVLHQGESGQTLEFSNYILGGDNYLYKDIDILKLLNGENYIREE